MPKPKPPPADDRATDERLLDTAERLFAEHGFDGVGMRALAEEAGVNLGATTYHYGSKEKLYVETFMRRFQPTQAKRLALLRAAEAAAGARPPAVEAIVESMLRPPLLTVLEFPHFPALLARNLFMPPAFMRAVLERELGPHIGPFVAALARALPHLPPETLHRRVMFCGGVLHMFAGHLSSLPEATRRDPRFVEAALGEMVRFASAGLASPAEQRATRRGSARRPQPPPRV